MTPALREEIERILGGPEGRGPGLNSGGMTRTGPTQATRIATNRGIGTEGERRTKRTSSNHAPNISTTPT